MAKRHLSPVWILSNNETSLSANSGALLVGGSVSGQHLSIDGDEIQSKVNGTTAGTLGLNPHGGDIALGTDLVVTDDVVSVAGVINYDSQVIQLDNAGGKSSLFLSGESPFLSAAESTAGLFAEAGLRQANVTASASDAALSVSMSVYDLSSSFQAGLFINPSQSNLLGQAIQLQGTDYNLLAGGRTSITGGTGIASGSGTGRLLVGSSSINNHLLFDGIGIQGRMDSVTPGVIRLNWDGGLVTVNKKAVPLGIVGYAVGETDHTGIGTSTTNVNDMSVTFTAEAGRMYRATFSGTVRQLGGTGSPQIFLSWGGSPAPSNTRQIWDSLTANQRRGFTVEAVIADRSGSVTVVGQAATTANTCGVMGASGYRRWLIVEDIGAV
jgi:hypothetical protein